MIIGSYDVDVVLVCGSIPATQYPPFVELDGIWEIVADDVFGGRVEVDGRR